MECSKGMDILPHRPARHGGGLVGAAWNHCDHTDVEDASCPLFSSLDGRNGAVRLLLAVSSAGGGGGLWLFVSYRPFPPRSKPVSFHWGEMRLPVFKGDNYHSVREMES